MTLYVDSSALLKRYVDEPDSDTAETLLRSDPSLLTARHTIVEVRRNLARLLGESDAVAAHLPPGAAAGLRATAGSAFTDAMGTGLLVGAILAAVMAVAVVALLPSPRMTPALEPTG